ncbi:hypothetical protein Dde_2610 [Oleidesulfovibrio alaskensis G20]|jgi:Fe-S-cluster containining protein|uniref:YkgJ family cysteine cluster protein n=1 Tax=Oleidesulfovibrio alaskensis (strain ATCC BAA-1058 / DSM 17464 / G20) TaxID=207559 RepID=Q30Y40_OLEA2|nr:hypothetical protein [Oleidesulfovibrio alaskensis]ABB39406.1 hypothetical protein Dde_2610 [Oleidesulfovibrio alaskensis G20]MBG0772513.1 hypothetical protein [Oleidesulfovibrio alaskensis]MBL3582125.1 hypothetical protein [Oleidesulfovibrio alaskensis]
MKHSRTAAAKRKTGVFARLADLYTRMEQEYSDKARAAGLTCAGCPDNCCTSYFQHHTHVEWLYLWRGMNRLPEARRAAYLARAKDVVEQSRDLLARGIRPRLMCPVNDDGLCGIYEHRLMICRMHGTRNVLALPDGGLRSFSGCFRFVECTAGQQAEAVPTVDRTPYYRELAALEMEHVGPRLKKLPRVDLTLAEMLFYGPPKL